MTTTETETEKIFRHLGRLSFEDAAIFRDIGWTADEYWDADEATFEPMVKNILEQHKK